MPTLFGKKESSSPDRRVSMDSSSLMGPKAMLSRWQQYFRLSPKRPQTKLCGKKAQRGSAANRVPCQWAPTVLGLLEALEDQIYYCSESPISTSLFTKRGMVQNIAESICSRILAELKETQTPGKLVIGWLGPIEHKKYGHWHHKKRPMSGHRR